jgi:hypothetical protein
MPQLYPTTAEIHQSVLKKLMLGLNLEGMGWEKPTEQRGPSMAAVYHREK